MPLHSEQTFVQYAKSISIDFSKDITYLDNLDIWDSLLSLAAPHNPLADMILFVNARTGTEHSGPKGLRLGLSALLTSGPELDPKRPIHRLVFGTLVSAFLMFLNLSVNSLKEVFEFSMSKDAFEKTIRYFVWEGRDNYEIRRAMRMELHRQSGAPSQFDLPEWDQFLHIIRSFLDAPEAIASLPFLAKEVAFRSMTGGRKDSDDHLRSRFAANNRARQFIFGAAKYLVSAGKLPTEFNRLLEDEINDLIDTSAREGQRLSAD
jgi:hypothetical protein